MFAQAPESSFQFFGFSWLTGLLDEGELVCISKTAAATGQSFCVTDS
jgi:hypothetical protein